MSAHKVGYFADRLLIEIFVNFNGLFACCQDEITLLLKPQHRARHAVVPLRPLFHFQPGMFQVQPNAACHQSPSYVGTPKVLGNTTPKPIGVYSSPLAPAPIIVGVVLAIAKLIPAFK